jgi:hypothetical protein
VPYLIDSVNPATNQPTVLFDAEILEGVGVGEWTERSFLWWRDAQGTRHVEQLKVFGEEVRLRYFKMNGSLSLVTILRGKPAFLAPINLQAQPGKLNEGFDPPQMGDYHVNPDTGDTVFDKDHWEWWTSVAKSGPYATNQKVKIIFESNTAAQRYEVFIPEDSRGLVRLGQGADPAVPLPITSQETNLTFHGIAGDTLVRDARILVRPKGGNGSGATPRVKVLPERDAIDCKFYSVRLPGRQDPLRAGPSVPNPGEVNARIASPGTVRAEIDTRFAHAVVGTVNDGSDFVEMEMPFEGENANGQLDPREFDYFEQRKNEFTAECNIIYVYSLSTSGGVLGWGDPITDRIYVGTYPWAFAQDAERLAAPEDPDGASFQMPRVIAHEFGHYLNLSTRRNASGEKHDDWLATAGTVPLMRSGAHGSRPPGKWTRHE